MNFVRGKLREKGSAEIPRAQILTSRTQTEAACDSANVIDVIALEDENRL